MNDSQLQDLNMVRGNSPGKVQEEHLDQETEDSVNRKSKSFSAIYYKVRANPRLKHINLKNILVETFSTHVNRSTDEEFKDFLTNLGSPTICFMKDKNLCNLLVKAVHY